MKRFEIQLPNFRQFGHSYWLVLLFIVANAIDSYAITYYSRANGNWNATTTWSTVSFASATNSGTFPIAGDIVNIGGGFALTVNVASACASITYESGVSRSNSINLNSGITLTVSGTITLPRAGGPGTSNINLLAVGAGNLVAGNLAFTATGNQSRHRLSISTGTATITGNITTNRSNRRGALILFSGAGILNIGGSLFSGGGGTLTPSTGTVNYNGSAAQTIGAFTYYNLTVTGNSTKSLRAASNVSNTLTVNAGAVFNLAGFSLGATTRPTGVILFCGAVLGSSISGTGQLSLGGNITVNDAGTGTSGAQISCPISLIATRTFIVADDGTTAKDLTLSGTISGGGFGVIKTGAGTLENAGLNSYSGTTTIVAGTLRATNNSVVASTNGPFGNNASGLNLGGGSIESNVTTFSRPITVTASNSRLDAYAAARTISSAINLASAGSFNLYIGGTTAASAEGQTLTLSGIISNTSGTLSITKMGTSTAIFSSSSSYTGVTTISSGVLIAGASVAVSANSPFGNSAASIVLGDANTSLFSQSASLLSGGAFTIARGITVSNQATTGVYSLGGNNAVTSLFSGNIVLNQPLSITQIAGGTVQLSGTCNTGLNKLSKIGAGTFQRTTATLAVGGDFEILAGTYDANTRATTVTGLTTVSGGVYTASSAAQTFNGGLSISGGTYNGLFGTAGATSATTITLNSGTLSAPGSTGNFSLSGNWTRNGGTFTTNNGTVIFNGTSQLIGGSSSTVFNNVTIAVGSTTSLAINTTISSLLTIAGTYDLNTFSSNRASAGGTMNVSGTLRLGGTSGGQTGSNFPTNFSTLTLTGSTINYYRINGGQTVYAVPVYVTLTLGNSSGSHSAGGNISCATLNTTLGGTFNMLTNTLTVSGVPNNQGIIATQNTGASPLSSGKSWGGTISYNAGANQTVVSGSYTILVLATSGNKSFAAALNISANLSISGTAKANLATFTSTSNTLLLGGVPQTNGSWGSTASPATNKNNTWFLSPSVGIINIAVAGCTNSTAAVLSGTASVCAGTGTNLSVVITGGTSPFSVVYTDGITPVTVNGYTSGTNIFHTPISTHTYNLVSVTGNGGCVGTGLSGTPTITVNSGSTSAVLAGVATICSGGSTNLNVAIAGGTSPFSVNYTDGITPVTVNGYISGTAIPVSPSATVAYSLISVTSTGGCAGSGLSGTPTVSVNQPAIANAGGNAVSCGATTYLFSAASAFNFSSLSWTSAGDGSFNNSTLLHPSYTFGAADLLAGSVSITLTANGISPCGSVPSTITLSYEPTGTWLGTSSSDWSNPSNWCGGIPGAGTPVIIPAGTTFSPVINSGNQSALSIHLEPLSSLTLTGGSLVLSGDINNEGNLTVGAGASLDMAANQVIGDGSVLVNGTFVSARATGFSGTANTALSNSLSSIILGTNSSVDYSSVGSQEITPFNYANLSNSGNGDRTFSNSGVIGISAVFSPGIGNYTVTGSNLEFNGSTSQLIPDLAPNSIYNSLEINNSAGVLLASNLNLLDALTLTDGAFNTNGFAFTLLSSASQTARIAPITGGSIVGDITMQRFVPGGNSGWTTLAMPVSGATISEWTDDIITSGFTGSTTGTGTFVSMYTYSESVAGNSDAVASYLPVSNASNAVDPLKGYFVFIADNATSVSDKLLDVTGPALTDDQDLNVIYTNNTNVNHDGWNLVANPYPSAIDWTSPDWTKTNIDNAIYIYNPDNAQYTGYVNGASFNGGNEIIASSQAFFVHANASSPSLVATEDVKDVGSPAFYKSGQPSVSNKMLHIQLSQTNSTPFDETIFRTKAGASSNFDPAFDAYKLYSFDPTVSNISSKVNGIEYVVNTVNELTANLDLPIRVHVTTAGTYTINFLGLSNFKSISCISLEDKLTLTRVDLKLDSFYTFTSAIDTVLAYNRFVLHFGVETIEPAVTPSATTVSLPGNATVNFTNTTSGANNYFWDFGDGSALETATNPSHTYLAAGVYTVTLTAINSAGCSQVTSLQITVDEVTAVQGVVAVESININKTGQGVYANYNFKNNTKVKVTVYNALGEQVGNAQYVIVQNSGNFRIETPVLAKGIYTIELLVNDTVTAKRMVF